MKSGGGVPPWRQRADVTRAIGASAAVWRNGNLSRRPVGRRETRETQDGHGPSYVCSPYLYGVHTATAADPERARKTCECSLSSRRVSAAVLSIGREQNQCTRAVEAAEIEVPRLITGSPGAH